MCPGRKEADLKTLGRKLLVFFIAAAAAMMMTYGCAFLGLQEDLTVLEQAAEISGKVIVAQESASPIFVVLYKDQGAKQVLHAYWIAYRSGEFRFPVPPGSYYLFAFEDQNEDAAFQPEERVGWYGDPSILTVGPGEVTSGVAIALSTPTDVLDRLPSFQALSVSTVPTARQNIHNGTVAQLSDIRFGPKYARKGLWEPVKFLEDPGGGIFFLEPYVENKIPVLFVHGSGGFPQQWGPIIKSLDRSRLQPWILHYPSGLRLGQLGEYLEKFLAELQIKYRFNQLFIVAHSMGGLISRCALNHNIEHRRSTFIRLLVTISTPWNGHPAAAYGVEQSPLVVPSWYDMVSESPFLKRLRETTLPPGVEYDLLFGYRGKAKRNGELSDGTVMLNSVLDDDMQSTASHIWGFDEDHISILKSPAVKQKLNQLLTKTSSIDDEH